MQLYRMRFTLKPSSEKIISFAKANKVSWRSPSNIALVKYWGKKGKQIPANPSLSFTLSKSYTETSILYSTKGTGGSVKIDFLFEGKENKRFQGKIENFLYQVTEYFPFLNELKLKIESTNSFPHSAGIASSASSMSALALCLCSIENKHFGTLNNDLDFYTKASFIARIGSGSASRSVFPLAASWGEIIENPISSDKFASPLPFEMHQKFKHYKDAILIISKGTKKVSSTVGHNLMIEHPFAKQRFLQAKSNLKALLSALKSGDEDTFIKIVENEALTLHGLMMSSNPGFILMQANTLNVIERIRSFREKTGTKICFTLDAGPNVHVLYPNNESNTVEKFINTELIAFCEDNFWISDQLGKGAIKV